MIKAADQRFRQILILLGLCYFFFIFGNGIVSLTNPDEVFYAQTAKEMIQQNSWMTPYLFGQPQFEKPIFLYWLLRLGFILFGIGSFAARFFPALFASFGVVAVYLFCLLGFGNEKKAFLSSLILLSSGVYIGLARSVFTDMIFSIFILLSLLSFFWAYSRQEKKCPGMLLFFIFSACAVLSKGPLGLIIPLVTVILFLLFRKDLKFIFSRYSFWGLLVFMLIASPWYILMISKYGDTFTYEFFYNDHIRRILEAEHISNDTWYFYPAAMVWGIFPWSLYVIVAIFYLFKNFKRGLEPIYTFLICWISAVFLIFQPAHSKLVSYIFPLFPALGIVAGDFIYGAVFLNKKIRSLSLVSWITAIILVIFIIGAGVYLVLSSDYILTYLSSKLPVYILLFLLSLLAVSFLGLVIRRNFYKSACLLIFLIPAMFCVVPLVVRDIEPFVSSRDSCAYLLNNYQVDNLLLCSKFFARGVRYYTDKETVVIDINGKGFFSPHPVLFLDKDNKVKDFLRQQKTTYAIVKKSSFKDLQRLSKEFEIATLKIIGKEYILKIKPRD